MAALAFGAATAGPIAGQELPTVGVDVDTAGNSAAALGAIEDCRTVALDETFDIDVYITNAERISGFQFDLNYDPAVLEVIGIDDQLFLADLPGSRVTSFSDSPPDADGSFLAAGVDFGDPETTYESGSGVLARITLRAVGPGQSPLSLSGVILTTIRAGQPGPVEPANQRGEYTGPILSANVAVDTACTPSPPPTPTPEPSPTATPAAGTPLTARAQTPAAVQTPIQEEGGGGIGAGAWTGIGVGIGVAALAVAVVGWLVARERRAGGG